MPYYKHNVLSVLKELPGALADTLQGHKDNVDTFVDTTQNLAEGATTASYNAATLLNDLDRKVKRINPTNINSLIEALAEGSAHVNDTVLKPSADFTNWVRKNPLKTTGATAALLGTWGGLSALKRKKEHERRKEEQKALAREIIQGLR